VQRETSFDVIIVGAGAAGLMCAIEAGKRGRRVAVLERSDRVGKKILISGGGRCNFTNLHTKPENFLSANPHFCKSALARCTPADFISLVEKHGIAYHEKTLGQLFCDGSSRQIVDMLLRECDAAGVRIFLNADNIRIERENSSFAVGVADQAFQATSLVIATGGLSIPKMGATSFGYDLARRFTLAIREPYPALVPLTFNTEDSKDYAGLAGISTEVIASLGRRSFREGMLFTHRGLSGPAVLQISSYWQKGTAITIDLAPGKELTSDFRDSATPRNLAAVKASFRKYLPARLADRWIDLHPPADFTNRSLTGLERLAHNWQFVPDGTEGFSKAEVTAGGIDTDELSAQTMECKKVPGLYFIGEVVEVTGHLGGFNFQWAWASGAAAGQAV
jgi:predicted Rossmann fold flavoprotein